MRLIKRAFQFFNTVFIYKLVFKKIGVRSIVLSPLKIECGKNISIGNHSLIGYKTWLAANPVTGSSDCKLEIHDGCSIGNFNHIYATKSIVIEKNVLIADKVYISDNLHGYRNPNLPIIKQPVIQNNVVVIGEGSWIGENVCVMGVTIGKNCVIGANSVVTKNVPSHCVAAGVPAKIIKRYNFESDKWEKTDAKGNFII